MAQSGNAYNSRFDSANYLWPPCMAGRSSHTHRARRLDEQGQPYNLTRIDISAHVGTHVDAPGHFSLAGGGIDSVPLDALMGSCRVWSPPGSGPITAEMFRSYHFTSIDFDPNRCRSLVGGKSATLAAALANSGCRGCTPPGTTPYPIGRDRRSFNRCRR